MVDWPKHLIESIARRKAVIIIGSGVSANCVDAQGNRPPTWSEFLERAAERLPKRTCSQIRPAIRGGNYLHACEYLKNAHGQAWTALLKEFFHDPQYKPSEIHRHIFDLDARIAISLNFDIIYDRYAMSNADGTYFVKNYYDDDLGQIIGGSDRYLIKAHGSIDAPGRLIFTLQDYARARNFNGSFYKILDAILILNTVIMVGCGLNDPDIQSIFENNRFLFDSHSHYMILPSGMHERQRMLFEESRGIKILEYKRKGTDHTALTTALGELVSLVEARREQLAREFDW